MVSTGPCLPLTREVAPKVPEGVYGNDFVEDDRTMAFSVSVAYTPSVMACAMTAPPTRREPFLRGTGPVLLRKSLLPGEKVSRLLA